MRTPPKLRKLARRRIGHRSSSPPALALVLPDDLTELDLVDGVSRALGASRELLAAQARHARGLVDEAKGEPKRRAYLAGRADAFAEAVARTDAALECVFGTSDRR